VRAVLAAKPGPALEVVALNAGGAILVGGGAEDVAGGVVRAREAIASGAAMKVLEQLVALSTELAPHQP
jgi:anthranilate phosphoribosyltransferase